MEDVPNWRGIVGVAARSRRPSILLTCMPKSASTYLGTALSLATGYPLRALVREHDRNEQDVYLPALAETLRLPRPTVVQQHARATAPNLDLIRLFNFRTVILIRDLFDAVVSFHDHLMQDSLLVPMAYVPESFPHLDERTRLDMVVDLVVPWYLGFFVSWVEACRRGWPALWVRYGEVATDPEGTVRRIMAYAEADGKGTAVVEAIDKARTMPIRFNKG
jgi:hypothetical protein